MKHGTYHIVSILVGLTGVAASGLGVAGDSAIRRFGDSAIRRFGDSATQTIYYAVYPINQIKLSATPGELHIGAAETDPGTPPVPVSDSSTSYAITTNCGTNAKKITAVLASNMPAEYTLQVELVAPAHAASAGLVTLSGTEVDVVTGIDTGVEEGLTISYTLSATA